MSFLEKILGEIALNGKRYSEKKQFFIYGLLLFSKNIKKDGVILSTNNLSIALMVLDFFKKEFSVATIIENKQDNFRIVLKDISQINEINIDLSEMKNQNEYISFLTAVFLACGNISEPKKGYHLEFSVGEYNDSVLLNNILQDLDFPSKITVRQNKNSSVYISESGGVEDFLTYIGATNSAMEIMNVKIVKEVRNRVNRTTNFETANIDRTAIAYAEQMFDIRYIIDNGGLDGLDSDLKDTIDIRIAFPDLSLKSLSEKFEPPISRSTVNYRLQKIRNYAKELKKRKER